MNIIDPCPHPVPASHRPAILALLLTVGVIAYGVLPDETFYVPSSAARGSRVVLDVRTGGFSVVYYWSPSHYYGHGATFLGFVLRYKIRTGVPWDNFVMVGLPWWFLLSLAAAPSLDRLGKRLADWDRARRVDNSGRCPGCGYDLRASPERCPECGRLRGLRPGSR